MGRARAVVVVASSTALLVACSMTSAAPSPTPTTAAPAGPITAAKDCGNTLREVAANAKKERRVNLIALPNDWANYGQILETFRDDYGIDAVVTEPDASSGEELQAVRTMASDPGRPDVIDVSPSFADQALGEGLLQPYRSTTWAQIPDNLKDPDGYWAGSYYGIMAIGTNTNFQSKPATSWAQLKNLRYRGQIGLDGDPRTSGAGFGAVVAAALANGGSFDDVMPGIQYFADLRKSGNLEVVDDGEALLTAKAPVALKWLFTIPREQSTGSKVMAVRTTVPGDGVYGSYYAQAITANAPHPCAAALWIEHINGDSGALGFLQGRAIPARFAALEAFGLVSDTVRASLPRPSQIYGIRFPTQRQLDRMKGQIDKYWGPMVGR